MSTKLGRPSPFAPEYVSDVAQQLVIAFYNAHPDLLEQKVTADPNFGKQLPTRAFKFERRVRQVLTAHQQVPKPYPENVSDICLLVYLADLDGECPKLLQAGLKANEHIYRERAELYRGSVINVLQAKARVDRKDYMFLDMPLFGSADEDEDF